MRSQLLGPPMPAAEFWTIDRRILARVEHYWSTVVNGQEVITGVRWKDECDCEGCRTNGECHWPRDNT